MSIKMVLWIIAVAFLIQGTYTAFLREDEFFIKNDDDDAESIKKARMNIFIVNLFLWGSVVILVNIFL